MASVARAEPPSKISSLSDWHTSQVRANTQHDQPFWLLYAIAVGLRVTKLLPILILGLLDLVLCAMAYEDRLPAPLDDDVLAFWDLRKVDFDFGLCQHVGGCGHVY